MIRPRHIAFVLLLACVCGQSFGQLSLESKSGFTVTGLQDATDVGGVLIVGPKSKPVLTPIAIVTIRTDAANTEVEIEDANRNQLNPDDFKTAPNVLTFKTAGRYWIEVTAIDFARNIYAKKKLTVEVLPAGPAGPDPIDNNETFDGLAAKVAAIAPAFDQLDRAKYYSAYSTVAQKMASYEIKTVKDANAWLASQGLTCRNIDACKRFSQLLNADAASRGTMSFAQAARWFAVVAEGLK